MGETFQRQIFSNIRMLLESAGDGSSLRRVSALMAIAYAMRHPTTALVAKAAREVLIARYYGTKLKQAIQENNLDLALEIARTTPDGTAIFQHYQKFGLDFKFAPWDTDRSETVTRIVRFLLSYDEYTASAIGAPSIKKAHYFFAECGGFGQDDSLAANNFSKLWTQYKTVCGLRFVDEIYFNGRITKLIESKTFTESVDSILSNDSKIVEYFGKVKYVHEKLVELLDYRVFHQQKLPSIPNNVASIPVTVVGYTNDARKRLCDYRALYR